jgi:hypothetical protein
LLNEVYDRLLACREQQNETRDRLTAYRTFKYVTHFAVRSLDQVPPL